MSWILKLVMFCILGLWLIVFIWLVVLEAMDRRTVKCRACKSKLNSAGGYYVPYVGSGFCERCSRDLMTEVKK